MGNYLQKASEINGVKNHIFLMKRNNADHYVVEKNCSHKAVRDRYSVNDQYYRKRGYYLEFKVIEQDFNGLDRYSVIMKEGRPTEEINESVKKHLEDRKNFLIESKKLRRTKKTKKTDSKQRYKYKKHSSSKVGKSTAKPTNRKSRKSRYSKRSSSNEIDETLTMVGATTAYVAYNDGWTADNCCGDTGCY